MNAVNHHETKLKIIEVARKLFSENGFEGTSIREIAKMAEVNVASINYHFGSKDQLFVNIIQNSTKNFEDHLKIFFENYLLNNKNAEEFFTKVFKHFLENSQNLVSTMKVIMSATHSQKMSLANIKEIEKGPPGVEYFIKVFKDQFNREIDEESLHWASTSMFSHMVHKTIIMSSCITEQDKNNPKLYCSEKDFEKGVIRLYNAIINQINVEKSHP